MEGADGAGPAELGLVLPAQSFAQQVQGLLLLVFGHLRTTNRWLMLRACV